MNKMCAVAKLLGVELNEVFSIEGKSCPFKLTIENLFFNDIDTGLWYEAPNTLAYLLNGHYNVRWPKRNDVYYYPNFRDADGFSEDHWTNHGIDIRTMNMVGIYKTREEAKAKARELGWLE